MRAFGLLFGIMVLITGIDLISIIGVQAHSLGLAFPVILGWLPWLSLAVYVGAVLNLKRVRSARWRWIGFAAATLVHVAAFAPAKMWWDMHTAAVPLPVPLSQENAKKLRDAYPVKWISSGKSLRLRREDYSEAMAAFAAKLAAGQPATK